MEATCRKAIEKWGHEKQTDMVVEELAELIQAIAKYKRYGRREEEALEIVGEMADVLIMLEQLTQMLNLKVELVHELDFKVGVLKQKINEDNRG